MVPVHSGAEDDLDRLVGVEEQEVGREDDSGEEHQSAEPQRFRELGRVLTEFDQGRQQRPRGHGQGDQEGEVVGLVVVADDGGGREDLDDVDVDAVEDLGRGPDDEQVAAGAEQAGEPLPVDGQRNLAARPPQQQERKEGRRQKFAADEGPDLGAEEGQADRHHAEQQAAQDLEAGDLADAEPPLEEGAVDHDHGVDDDPHGQRAEHIRQVRIQVGEDIGESDQHEGHRGADADAPGQHGAVGLARIAHQMVRQTEVADR